MRFHVLESAAYGASKAFNLVFGEALHNELIETGIDVLVSAPGAVATPFCELPRRGKLLSNRNDMVV